MADQIKLADIVVDCPDEQKLCTFYQELLGWSRSEMFGHPAVVSENGVMFLFVHAPCGRAALLSGSTHRP